MNRSLRAALALLVITVMYLCAGCDSHRIANGRPSPLSDSDIKRMDFAELSNDEGRFFSKCYLISDSRLLLVYYNMDYIYQFKIYDLKQQQIISTSEEIMLENRHGNFIHLLRDYFYYFHEGKCYVYDFSCQLVKVLPISEDILRFSDVQYWLSNDLTKIAYVKNNGNAYSLYWSDADGANEEIIQPVSVDLSPEEIIFSQDNRTIGFWGCAIPKGMSDSMDCYGYIIPEDGTVKLYYQDNTHAEFCGDTILILNNSPINPNAPREGKVRTLDLSSKKHAVITTKFADECEWAVLGSDTRYMVGVHWDEENLTVYLTVYKNGKTVKEIRYPCQSEENFADLSGSSIAFDAATHQIMVFFYDTSLGKNIIIALPSA